jgi:serine/threonine protein kinase
MMESCPDLPVDSMNQTLVDAPKCFGPFELLEKIGHGGNATVHKARHKTTGKIVAIKVARQFLEMAPGSLERFKREFTVIRRLQHANIVRALGLGEADEVPFLVLEYVPGPNLEEHLKQRGHLSFEDAATIFLQVTEGLRYLHTSNILHRDIKPSNIFLGREHHAKLGDFGLLRNLSDNARITGSHQGMGTMEYGAPEQFEDLKRVDHRCDLYSLAATLYTGLTGKFPFGVGGQLQILRRKLQNQFVPLRLLLPGLPPALDRLVSSALDPDPEKRPHDCSEFIAALQGLRDGPVLAPVESEMRGITPAENAERRVAVRFAVDLTTSFVPFHQKMRGRWEASIIDISTKGVRLRTPRSVAVNSVLELTFNRGAISELVLVCWTRCAEGDSQITGCLFVRDLPSEQVEALCQARKEPA